MSVINKESAQEKHRGMRDKRPRVGLTMRLELETDRFYLAAIRT